MKARPLRLRLCQDDATVGAIGEIRARMLERVGEARRDGIDLVVFPELATVGYPPKDLLELPRFVDANLETVRAVAEAARGVSVVLGHVARNEEARGKGLRNAASLVRDGEVLHTWVKALLPSYDVFDETRYFEPGREAPVVSHLGRRIGVTVCEDVWTGVHATGRALYHREPAKEQAAAGADLLLNVSASPYEVGKLAVRHEIAGELALETGVPVVYANQFGAQDELVFDGGSFAVDGRGRLVAQGPFLEPGFVDVVLPEVVRGGDGGDPEVAAPAEGTPAVLRALEVGLRGYLRKCGFERVVVGLSGGVDSALTAAIAVRALGADRVVGLLMPSPYSSDHSVADALALAGNLGIRHEVLPIGDLMAAYDRTLAGVFEGRPPDVTEENLQARIRGNLLMAFSNKHGHLVLSTGNKSEIAVGYCTLYGDMAGGLALLSDVPKTMVYALAALVNEGGEVIPRSTIEKAPSAELRPGQKDTDSLPPYDLLDPVIEAYVEDLLDEDAIVRLGHERDIVRRVVSMIHASEYKRRQAAPGIKVTSKAFGFGRRFPIAHRRDW